ncbi:MAG: alpha/beta fold hydrolase [Phycisphaerae bacterium]
MVMYPGAANVYAELAAWHDGLREYGVQHAIEVMPWGIPWDALANLQSLDRNRGWSEREAERVAAYMDAHPDRPVTLIGYSSGAMIAIMVVESLPDEKHVDRVILMSATVSRDYDLTTMLENTNLGAIHYFSPSDAFSDFVSLNLGATDRVFDLPGATVGFSTESDKLIQVPWSPEMGHYGNHGGHFDILFRPPFIRDFMGPWVVVETSVE